MRSGKRGATDRRTPFVVSDPLSTRKKYKVKDLSFVDVPAEYVNYLRNFETSVQGFSRIPLVDYEAHNRKGKFFCGVVLQINDYQYFVPVSSNTLNHPHTFYLYDHRKRIGSLRFGFMFPVPEHMMKERLLPNEVDPQYRRLLEKELACCQRNENVIREMALKTYMTVTLPGRGMEPRHLARSCDFRVLEGACTLYAHEHGLLQDRLDPTLEMLNQSRPRTLDEIIASATTRAAELNAGRAADRHEAHFLDKEREHE